MKSDGFRECMFKIGFNKILEQVDLTDEDKEFGGEFLKEMELRHCHENVVRRANARIRGLMIRILSKESTQRQSIDLFQSALNSLKNAYTPESIIKARSEVTELQDSLGSLPGYDWAANELIGIAESLGNVASSILRTPKIRWTTKKGCTDFQAPCEIVVGAGVARISEDGLITLPAETTCEVWAWDEKDSSQEAFVCRFRTKQLKIHRGHTVHAYCQDGILGFAWWYTR